MSGEISEENTNEKKLNKSKVQYILEDKNKIRKCLSFDGKVSKKDEYINNNNKEEQMINKLKEDLKNKETKINDNFININLRKNNFKKENAFDQINLKVKKICSSNAVNSDKKLDIEILDCKPITTKELLARRVKK